MTDVKYITDRCFGLVATKVYHVGDIVIDYNDNDLLIQLAPSNDQEQIELIQEFIDIKKQQQQAHHTNNDPKATTTTTTTTTTVATKRDASANSDPKKVFFDYLTIVDDKDHMIVMNHMAKWKGMIQAACCYIHKISNGMIDESQRKKIQLLYHPQRQQQQQYNHEIKNHDKHISQNDNITNITAKTPLIDHNSHEHHLELNQYENQLMEIVKYAWEWMKCHLNNMQGKIEHCHITENELMNVMLIWSCNSFQGGYIYETMSRINHSCNPNCIVQTSSTTTQHNNNQQRIVASCTIDIGHEITISYLGIFLYSDTNTRQMMLLRDKYFLCQCSRCSCIRPNDTITTATTTPTPIIIDRTRGIPCPIQHPRLLLNQLDEDDQYDDDHSVLYAYPEKHSAKQISTTKQQQIGVLSKLTDSHTHSPITEQCYISTAGKVSSNDKKYQRLFELEQTIISKVISYIDDHDINIELTTNNSKSNGTNNKQEHEVLLERHLQLASTILGKKHWTTNILLLFHLNESLQKFHKHLLTQSLGVEHHKQQSSNYDDHNNDDIDDPVTYLAECIDQLQRIYEFVEGLKDDNEIQYLHPGHLLCDVTIGVARGLVSLGDEKSQKYANEWLLKISSDYVSYFESSGIQKVVQTLQDAWQRNKKCNNHIRNDQDDQGDVKPPPSKRFKN
jgi:SET domain